MTDEVVEANNAGKADTMRTALAIIIPIQPMEEVFTYKPPRRKMALIIHFSLEEGETARKDQARAVIREPI